jgi:hypothetical protein
MRVCPECGEEYLPTVSECADCRVALVAAGSAAPAAPTSRELPPVSQLVCVRTASLGFAQGLSDLLSEAGITHRLEAQEPDEPAPEAAARGRFVDRPFGVYVREQDLADAREVDREFMRRQFPDVAEDATVGAVGEGCPACGAAVAADAAECPECGLALLEA